MEGEPNTENVCYIDEYPHLEERVRVRRMGQLMLFRANQDQLILFPIEGEGGEDEGA